MAKRIGALIIETRKRALKQRKAAATVAQFAQVGHAKMNHRSYKHRTGTAAAGHAEYSSKGRQNRAQEQPSTVPILGIVAAMQHVTMGTPKNKKPSETNRI
jgi:hypothetical protein